MALALALTLTLTLTKVEYENALSMAANGNMEEANMLPLCHTCHIVRPLRSKHCSVQKRCVSCFDHFCPYVNNTMGSRNYKYFILFMAFGLVGVSMLTRTRTRTLALDLALALTLTLTLTLTLP